MTRAGWEVLGPGMQIARSQTAMVFWPTRRLAIVSACWLGLASQDTSGWPGLRARGWRVVRVRIEDEATGRSAP